ncbi:Hypothetical_protein [Hexamita inflata]|uniref:Hypothetical_protein n=1 Tax=Hexamita inflata TaxID=28002 RepID=A0AA86ND94_9EUKA|nr:Hypothetical protein HINF_LOCUS5307 [Hexamita inflata]
MQNQPQQFDSFKEFMQSEIAIHEKIALNYPNFENSYDSIQSFQKQYSNALTIENQIQIFSHRCKNDVTRNLTIIEEDMPARVPQISDEEEDEEEQQTNMAVVKLPEKLWGTVIPEQKGKLLFWSEHKFKTVGVIVTDNEFISVDQQFIQAYCRLSKIATTPNLGQRTNFGPIDSQLKTQRSIGHYNRFKRILQPNQKVFLSEI